MEILLKSRCSEKGLSEKSGGPVNILDLYLGAVHGGSSRILDIADLLSNWEKYVGSFDGIRPSGGLGSPSFLGPSW